jgi:hypothetical protein
MRLHRTRWVLPYFAINEVTDDVSKQTGLKACIAGYALTAAFYICLYTYYVWENRRRDRRYGRPEEMTVTQELQDELSNKTDWEIESFRYVL